MTDLVKRADTASVQSFFCKSCGEQFAGPPMLMDVVIGYIEVCSDCWEAPIDD